MAGPHRQGFTPRRMHPTSRPQVTGSRCWPQGAHMGRRNRQEGREGAPAGPCSSLGTHQVPGPLQGPGANLTETAAIKEPARPAVAVMSERKPVLRDKACPQEKPAYQSLTDSSRQQPSCHTWGPGQPERGTCTHSPGHRLAKGLSPASAGLCVRAPCVRALSDLRPPCGGGCPLEQRKRWLREVL